MHADRPVSARRLAAPFVLPLLLAIAITALTVAVWPSPRPPIPMRPAAQPELAAPAIVVAPADAAAAAVEREAAPVPAIAAPGATFGERVAELVRIGRRTAEFAQQDDVDAANVSDREARQRFAELMGTFPDAGELALAAAGDVPDDGPDTHGYRIVLQLILDAELERRGAAADAAGDRSRVDALAGAVLDSMPVSRLLRDIGERALVDRPWLRAVHERSVLAIVELAAAEQFDRKVATRLLLTLWRNLQQFGERSSDELTALALLLLGDADPSRRTVACRQLLGDARYRHLVFAWLREQRDATTAGEVANIAARELEPADALTVLRELAPVLPRAPGTYLLLGFRAPEAVADSYRELLATDTQPGVRSDLVTGVGMTRTPLGLEIAQLALHHDPSPEVRVQAVFVLTANADPDAAERAVNQLLDDRLVADDPTRLGAIVLAMQNFEAGGHHNTLARLGDRLRRLPLATATRQSLEAMLQRGVPGGTANLPPLPR